MADAGNAGLASRRESSTTRCLNEVDVTHFIVEFALGVALEKISACVDKNAGLDNHHPFNFGLDYLHSSVDVRVVGAVELVDNLHQILSVLIFEHRLCQLNHLFTRYPAATVCNSFKTCYLKPLTLLKHFHID